MKKFRLFLLMLSAAVLPFTACQTGGEGVDGNGDGSNDEGGGVVEVVTPTVEVTLVEGSVTANGFLATVVTTNAEAAAWKVLAHGEAAPEAAVVLDEGASLALPENGPATVVVEYLNPETEYCLYVAVKAGEQYALSAPLCVTTLAETPDTPVDPGNPDTPAGPTELEFYADVTMGSGTFQSSMSLMDGVGLPGHMFYATSANGDFAMMVLFDYDFQSYGCESYSYLTAHETVYPLVAGSVNEGNFPSVSCVLVDPGYTNFEIGGKTYYPVVPESATDANGQPYGVWVATMAPEGQDLNMLTFSLPAVDDDNNSVVIVGSYTGPLGYNLSAGGTTQTYPFVMNGSQGYGFDEFAATKDGDKLTLKSSNHNGDLVFVLDLAQNNGEVEGTWMALEDGTGSLTGYFFDSLDGEFPITSGQFALEATETPGQYTLIPSSRNPVLFVGPYTRELDSSVDYTITVTGL